MTDDPILHSVPILFGKEGSGNSHEVAQRIAVAAGEALQLVGAKSPSATEAMATLLVALSALQRMAELEGLDSAKVFGDAEKIALTIAFDVQRMAEA